jgi:glycosyltransferase involved in cell wall biosynthesis
VRIGVDARAAAEERGGRGTVVRELIAAWDRAADEHQFVLYSREPWGPPLGERFSWRTIRARDPLWHLQTARRAGSDCDVFLSTNSYLTAWALRIPTSVMVMDLVAWRPHARPQRRAGIIERATLPIAARRAGALQCISQATASDLAGLFPRAAGRIHVVPLAADASFSEEGTRADIEGRRYVLAVGTLEPRKNLPRLVEAFARLSAEVRQDRLLVLVGALGWDTSETVDTLRRHSALVRELGHVDDDELRALYRGAELFAYPSLYEGFGLPVLEAMASGTPVLTSRTSSLPEVAGDAAVYVDPRDIDSIASGLGEALTDPDRLATLTAKGIERARLFSWDRTAAETLGLLEQLYARRGARS